MKKPILVIHTPLEVMVRAARTCTDTIEKMETVWDCVSYDDKILISNRILKQNRYCNVVDELYEYVTTNDSHCSPYIKVILDKLKEPIHDSVLEHINYTFELQCSRAVLQELARHRHASLSVQSTRYTLKKIVKNMNHDDMMQLLAESGNDAIDVANDEAIDKLIDLIRDGKIKNDRSKYGLPEAFLTTLIWTINARSLRNFFHLRTHRRALEEIRILAKNIFNVLPSEHKFMFYDVIW